MLIMYAYSAYFYWKCRTATVVMANKANGISVNVVANVILQIQN